MTSRTSVVVVIAVVGGAILSTVPSVIARAVPWLRMAFGFSSDKADRRPHRRALDAYHQLHLSTAPDSARSNEIDDRTWSDLDLDDVFRTIDKTRSRPGQQYLHHLLRTPQFVQPPLDRINAIVAELNEHAPKLEQLRATLSALDDPRAGFLVDLAFGELPERPRLWWIFPLLTLCAIASIVLLFFWLKALVLLIIICILNIGAQIFYRPHVEALLPAISQVPAFIRVAGKLGTMQLDECAEQLATLRAGSRNLTILERTTRWLILELSQNGSELAASLYTYTNMLFSLDLNAFVFGLNAARNGRQTLQDMFEALGYLDAMQAIAEVRQVLPYCCIPRFTPPAKAMHVADVAHPLVQNAVGNSIEVANTSVLITGSNMSGKTTFVRALGVNAVLAQTIATAYASHWHAPFVSVKASIGRMDSIMEGKSYYLAEVESVRRLVRAGADGKQHLFLLDEIFRGTNTAERVAAAFAVLLHLTSGDDITVVATHDLELLDMLGGAYTPYHFREHITDGVLGFDFVMRSGVATTRNAIALLELMEYPSELVGTARRTLAQRAG